ncbi:Xaa-Pro aminopeptidase [Syntrophus gentianae]|uniref:Xaa-Pro aminopeptidase n=1 Tax=Syntrophus gentianae TaxID=43775 RepID=A0A1H7YXN1_9BACT|nr:Xaa-Pro peptidase family protein [Syntrophus gentianae]SEM51062.1 Xaa-Pro aminopeptidase [Syntrophus gentianae]
MVKSLDVCDFTPREELEKRLNALRSRMANQGISFAVILQNVDLFYFTGTVQKGVLVVPADGSPVFFVKKSISRALYESPLEITPIRKPKDIRDVLREKNMLKGTGAMELDVVPVLLFEQWKSILGYEQMADISPLVKQVRVIKSEFEIKQILKSGEIVSHVFRKAKDLVREGRPEVEIEADLVAEGRRIGHQGLIRMRGFNQEMICCLVTQGYSSTVASWVDVPIAGFGLSPAIGQGSSANTVKRGIPVIIDYGGGYNGYVTDETRVYVVGEMKGTFRNAYEVARDVLHDIKDFAKEGVDVVEVYARIFDRVKKAGLEEYFMGHGEGQVAFIGHGFGLELNELPVITASHKTVLKEGMVMAIEPKFIIPNEGAIGIEADFVVRKDGLQRIVGTPLDLVTIPDAIPRSKGRVSAPVDLNRRTSLKYQN